MNRQLGKIIIAVWFIMAILCFSVGIYQTMVGGFGTSYMFYILGVVSLAMFQFRRMMLKKSTKSESIPEKSIKQSVRPVQGQSVQSQALKIRIPGMALERMHRRVRRSFRPC